MIKLTNFDDSYLEQLQAIDFMAWLRVQWDSTVARENVIAAVDEENGLLGICILGYDGTWYYLDQNRNDIPLYRMQMELAVKEDYEDEDALERLLIEAAKKRLLEIKKRYPDKKLCIRCWCEENECEKQQQLLELGFLGNNLIWVMAFDLENTEIPKIEEQEDISFEVMPRSEEAVKEYMTANELGYDNVKDAEGELWFRLGDERTEVLETRKNGKVVSSATVWHISNERAASENIFTIPECRRMKLGTYTIAKTLAYLKERGYKEATLSCTGVNANAIALYNSVGYKVIGHLLEMHWEV